MNSKNSIDLISKHTEFETKYRVDPVTLTEFKSLMNRSEGLNRFLYVEGPDTYYTNERVSVALNSFADKLSGSLKNEFTQILNDTFNQLPPFVRHRKPSHGLDGSREELTTKYKQSGSTNNVQREEKNIRISHADEETVVRFLDDFGYKLNFSIFKLCHIYFFDDANVVYYSVYDTTSGKSSKVDTFVEIEVDESKISSMTEDQAWGIIEKYEKKLESIGVSSRSRLRRSLFEMFKKDIK